MKRLIITILIGGIAFFLYSKYSESGKTVVSDTGDRIAVSKEVVPYMPALLAALKNESKGSLCIKTQPPYNKGNTHSYICDEKCKRFEKMGLISLKSNASGESDLRYKFGDLTTDYELTETGELAYPPSRQETNHEFCLGETKYKRIVKVSSIENRKDGEYIYVLYTKSVVNPHSALYSAFFKKNDIKFEDTRVPIFPQNTTESIPIVYSVKLLPNNQVALINGDELFAGNWAVEVMNQKNLEKQEFEKRKVSQN